MKKIIMFVVIVAAALGVWADQEYANDYTRMRNNNVTGVAKFVPETSTVIRVDGGGTALQKAIGNARSGDVILVGPGKYSQIKTEGKDITIHAVEGPEKTFIMCGRSSRGSSAAAMLVSYNELAALFNDDGDDFQWSCSDGWAELPMRQLPCSTLIGFTITADASLPADCFAVNGGRLVNCVFRGMDSNRYGRKGFGYLHAAEAFNCLLVAEEIDSEIACDSSLVNCTVVVGGHKDENVPIYCSELINTIVYALNDHVNVEWSSPCPPRMKNLLCGNLSSWNFWGEDTGSFGGAESFIYDDPLFKGAQNGDYRLTEGSPAIDAGRDGAISLDLLAYGDLCGLVRKSGDAVDIGAYEYGSIAVDPVEYESASNDMIPFISAAETFNGYVVDGNGSVAGTVQIKAGKPNKKTGVSKLTASVTMLGEKKVSIKGETVDGSATMTSKKDGRVLIVDLAADAMTGTFDDKDIIFARNIFTAKDDGSKAAAATLLQKVEGVYVAALLGEDGVGALSIDIKKKGKVKVSGTLPGGVKVSVNTQLMAKEDGSCEIPVVYSKKNASLSIVAKIAADGSVSVTGYDTAQFSEVKIARHSVSVSDAMLAFSIDAADVAASFAGVADVNDSLLPDGVTLTQERGKWKAPKAGKVKYKNGVWDISGENHSGLKLSYKSKTGMFTGSFKVFGLVNGRLKKYSVKVSGVVVDGIGYGTATVKKPATSWSIILEPYEMPTLPDWAVGTFECCQHVYGRYGNTGPYRWDWVAGASITVSPSGKITGRATALGSVSTGVHWDRLKIKGFTPAGNVVVESTGTLNSHDEEWRLEFEISPSRVNGVLVGTIVGRSYGKDEDSDAFDGDFYGVQNVWNLPVRKSFPVFDDGARCVFDMRDFKDEYRDGDEGEFPYSYGGYLTLDFGRDGAVYASYGETLGGPSRDVHSSFVVPYAEDEDGKMEAMVVISSPPIDGCEGFDLLLWLSIDDSDVVVGSGDIEMKGYDFNFDWD